MPVMTTKGDWLPRLREALGRSTLSMRALSEKAGFSPNYLSALVRGEIDKRGPSADSLRRIAEAAGVDADWMITGKGLPEPGASACPPAPPPGTKICSGESARSTDDPYVERHRALVLLRPHLEGDGGRVRDYLLSFSGAPYETWEAREWLALAEQVRETVRAVDAAWGRKGEPLDPAAGRKAKAGKGR
jgi:transcriptional regulator with XRE-family HTH domain